MSNVRTFSTKAKKDGKKKGKKTTVDLHTSLVNFALNNKKHLELVVPKQEEKESLVDVLDQIKALNTQSLFMGINDSLLKINETHNMRVI